MVLNGFGKGPCGCGNKCDCSKCSGCYAKCMCETGEPEVCADVCRSGQHRGHMRGVDFINGFSGGFSGIADSISDAAGAVTKCPVPFLIGIGVGYLIKKSGMLKKITL